MAFCSQCGKKITKTNQAFCNNCGSIIPKTEIKNEKLNSLENVSFSAEVDNNHNFSRNKRKKTKLNHLSLSIIVILVVGFGGALGVFLAKTFSNSSPKLIKEVSSSKTNQNSSLKQNEETTTEPKDTNETSKDKESNQNKEEKIGTINNVNVSDFIFPESATRKLTESDIIGLSSEEIRLARNEIYARHGYVFKSEELQAYFSQKSWYFPDPSYKGEINEIETYNVNFLKSKEE